MIQIKIDGISPEMEKRLRQLSLLLWGLVWAAWGGIAPVALQLWWDYTTYQDYGPNWTLIRQQAMIGAGPMVIGYWRKHRAEIRALLQIPEDVETELQALRAATGQFPIHPAPGQKAIKEQ